MELEDCAFPLLAGMVQTDDADMAFGDVDVALLVGAMPRKEGMERSDLLTANGGDLQAARARRCPGSAKRDVKVLVVGNPANTNASSRSSNAKDLDPEPLHRDDPARPQPRHRPARRQGRRARSNDVTKMTIWGNHSATQYPDVFHAEVGGKPAFEAVGADQAWLEDDFIPTVQQRGAAVIKARGLSSAASAANAAVDHVRSWVLGTPEGDWVSMGVVSDGSYGVARGHHLELPLHLRRTASTRSSKASTSTTSAAAASTASDAELVEERAAVKELGLI